MRTGRRGGCPPRRLTLSVDNLQRTNKQNPRDTSRESAEQCGKRTAFQKFIQRTTGEVLLVSCVGQLGTQLSKIRLSWLTISVGRLRVSRWSRRSGDRGNRLGKLLERGELLSVQQSGWRYVHVFGGGRCMHRLSRLRKKS